MGEEKMKAKSKLYYRFFFCFLIALLLLLFLFIKGKGGEENKTVEKEISFPVMGTIACLKIQGEKGDPPEKLEKALAAMQELIRSLEKECNFYDPASPLSHLNREAHKKPFPLSGHLWVLLQESRRFYAFSEGSFDITISPLMQVWGFHRKRNTLPGKEEILKAKKFVGLEKLLFDDEKKTLAFPGSGFRLDLGGIAKGYALDLARKKAEDMGIFRGVLDLGGNILTLPQPYHGRKGYRIGIRDPRKKELLAVVDMPPGMCMATSGSYHRFSEIDGKRYSHIIDPVTGYPIAPVSLSATVLTEKGVHSDALSTILFIKGEAFMDKITKEFPRTQLLYFRKDENGKMLGFFRGKVFAPVVKNRFKRDKDSSFSAFSKPFPEK